MGAAPLVILLVGLVVPIAVLILALVIDAFVLLWLMYGLWRDEGALWLWQALRQRVHMPHWHWHPAHHH